MTDDEKRQFARDLAIRLDERLKSFEHLVERLEEAVKNAPCQRNTEKIRTLERITWAAVVASIGAIVRTFWSGGQ